MSATGHLPRPRYLCDWEDWRRPRPGLVKRIEYRRADTGTPVIVLVPTLRGRLVMLVRQWREV